MSLRTAGTYKCEVSGEAPSFKTRFDQDDMVVVVTPSKAEIVGAQPKYLVGDTVNVTCFSYRYKYKDKELIYHSLFPYIFHFRSKPAASLTWKVNGVEVVVMIDLN